MQSLSTLFCLVILAGLTSTAAATVHPLSGNVRFQIGDGPPMPITFTAAPAGKVQAAAGAVVSQPAGPDPRAIKFDGGELAGPPVGFNIPVMAFPGPVFQVFTSIGVTYPLVPGSFAAGGRKGHTTVHYCAGQVVTPTGDPGCASPADGPGINGLMIYTATGAQFGGAMTGRIFGQANTGLYGGGSFPPCSGTMCVVVFITANPNSTGTGHVGSPFGGSGMSPGGPPPSGIVTANVTAGGIILSANPTSLMNPGFANPVTSAGGPWTTGMITVSVTAALAGAEVFVLSGSDARVSGEGSISLVSGGMSNRGISGPNANRGWLNLNIGSAIGALPTMSGPGFALLVGVASLGGVYAIRARKSD